MATKPRKTQLKNPDKRIEFNAEDFDILDLALSQDQELRLCAGIVKAARQAQTAYPLESPKTLIGLLPKRSVFVEGHHLNEITIDRYLIKEYFPIENEAELIARCYVALMRCRDDVRWAEGAPAYAAALLKEVANVKKPQGGE